MMPVSIICCSGIWSTKGGGSRWMDQRSPSTLSLIHILMAHSVLWPEEIDRVRAEEAKQRAEEMIRQAKSVQEYVHFKASIARAVARLQVTNNHNVNMD